MHTAPILIVRIYTGHSQTGEVGYHGYTTQRFGTGRATLYSDTKR